MIEVLKNQVEPEMSTWNGERRWEMMMSRFMFINYDTELAKILQQMQSFELIQGQSSLNPFKCSWSIEKAIEDPAASRVIFKTKIVS